MIRSRRASEAQAKLLALCKERIIPSRYAGLYFFPAQNQMATIREVEAARDRLDTCRTRPRGARYFIRGRTPGFRFERRRVTPETVRNLVVRGYATC